MPDDRSTATATPAASAPQRRFDALIGATVVVAVLLNLGVLSLRSTGSDGAGSEVAEVAAQASAQTDPLAFADPAAAPPSSAAAVSGGGSAAGSDDGTVKETIYRIEGFANILVADHGGSWLELVSVDAAAGWGYRLDIAEPARLVVALTSADQPEITWTLAREGDQLSATAERVK